MSKLSAIVRLDGAQIDLLQPPHTIDYLFIGYSAVVENLSALRGVSQETEVFKVVSFLHDSKMVDLTSPSLLLASVPDTLI